MLDVLIASSLLSQFDCSSLPLYAPSFYTYFTLPQFWRGRERGWGDDAWKEEWDKDNSKCWQNEGCNQTQVDKCNQFIEVRLSYVLSCVWCF